MSSSRPFCGRILSWTSSWWVGRADLPWTFFTAAQQDRFNLFLTCRFMILMRLLVFEMWIQPTVRVDVHLCRFVGDSLNDSGVERRFGGEGGQGKMSR